MHPPPTESNTRRRSFLRAAGAALAGLIAGIPILGRVWGTRTGFPSGPESHQTVINPHRQAVPRSQKTENQNG